MIRRAVLIGALSGLGCSAASESGTLGFDEPLRVRNAQFFSGPLPGAGAPADGVAGGAGSAGGASVTSAGVKGGTILQPGQGGIELEGRATPGSFSVAMKFAGLGSGYWVIPVGAADSAYNDEHRWSAEVELATELTPGVQNLVFAAIDGGGSSGNQRSSALCITPRVPDNLNACDPARKPPALVLSLEWDAEVDLDLRVLTPEGKWVDAKRPSTGIEVDGGVPDSVLADPRTGKIDGDSNRGCSIDGRRLENLIWQEKPNPGRFAVYANLYAACGRSSVRFKLAAYTREELGDGLFGRVASDLKSGFLLELDANGGAGPGLFVTEVDVF